MDDLRIGAACRALRRRLGWRQTDLAERVGVHQTTISRIERGALGGLTLNVLRAVFAALGSRFDAVVQWRGGELDRLLDERHARLVEVVAKRYRDAGWQVIPEASFSHYGDRGSIDLLCGRADTRCIAVNEIKSRITSVEETNRRQDVKMRIAHGLAQDRFGWRPAGIGRILVLPDESHARRIVAGHPTVFDANYPQRTREIGRWIRTGTSSIAATWFIAPLPPADPRSRGLSGSRVVRGRTP